MHGTRKTCGSFLAALDVQPRVAMQILRHSKIAVTMEIYTEFRRPPPATRSRSSGSGSETRPLLYSGVVRGTKRAGSVNRNRPVSWVGDTGIEPVTSSV